MTVNEIDLNEYEVCISCGIVTNIPKSLNIYAREGYVEGCGQLCQGCHIRIIRDEKEAKLRDMGIV